MDRTRASCSAARVSLQLEEGGTSVDKRYVKPGYLPAELSQRDLAQSENVVQETKNSIGMKKFRNPIRFNAVTQTFSPGERSERESKKFRGDRRRRTDRRGHRVYGEIPWSGTFEQGVSGRWERHAAMQEGMTI